MEKTIRKWKRNYSTFDKILHLNTMNDSPFKQYTTMMMAIITMMEISFVLVASSFTSSNIPTSSPTSSSSISQTNLRTNTVYNNNNNNQMILPSIYGSHQVFKHSTSQILWGIAEPDDDINIKLSDNSFHNTVKSDAKTGRFEFLLPSHPPTPISSSIDIVITSTKDSLTLTDITFGEVLLCGGQSNMAISVRMAMNASYEISRSDIPELRILQVANLDSFGKQSIPLINTTMSIPWSKSSPDVIPTFSAVCYFTGKNLLPQLPKGMTLGLVESCWGGTIIETWMSPEALKVCNANDDETNNNNNNNNNNKKYSQEYEKRQFIIETNPNLPYDMKKAYHLGGPHTSSALYNSMIYPLFDLEITGILFYQAESNVDPAPAAFKYKCKFKSLINSWRSSFNNNSNVNNNIVMTKKNNDAIGFVYVQISDWPYDGDLISDMRYAQEAGLTLPNVAQVVAADIGDVASPNNNIHPDNKQEVGRRAAIAALSVIFKHENIIHEGPRHVHVEAVRWDPSWGNFHSNTGMYGYCNYTTIVRCVGIQISFNQEVYSRDLLNNEMRSGFEIWCGNLWQPVMMTGLINSTTIQLNLTMDSSFPAELRYGFGMYPYMHLYNSNEFPAPAFNVTIPDMYV